MVDERRVLLRIEHLEHRGERIAARSAALHLVDLVDHQHGIAHLHAAQRLQDQPRQRSDVRAAVPADLRFVAHAADGDAIERSPDRLRDRLAQRGLARARRADEAEDRAVRIAAALLEQLAHRRDTRGSAPSPPRARSAASRAPPRPSRARCPRRRSARATAARAPTRRSCGAPGTRSTPATARAAAPSRGAPPARRVPGGSPRRSAAAAPARRSPSGRARRAPRGSPAAAGGGRTRDGAARSSPRSAGGRPRARVARTTSFSHFDATKSRRAATSSRCSTSSRSAIRRFPCEAARSAKREGSGATRRSSPGTSAGNCSLRSTSASAVSAMRSMSARAGVARRGDLARRARPARRGTARAPTARPIRTRARPSSVTWIVSAPDWLRSFTRAKTPTRPSRRAGSCASSPSATASTTSVPGLGMGAEQREVVGGAHLHGDGAVGEDDRRAQGEERQLGRAAWAGSRSLR